MFTVRPEVSRLKPYVPGKPVSEVQREFGLAQVVKLASNENPLGPSPRAVEAVRAAAAGANIYPEASGQTLREALGARLGLPADWIMVGNGSDELLRLLAASYVQPGDLCVVPACSFPNYRAVADLFGGQAVEVPLRNEAMDLDEMAIAAATAPGARMLFLCRPNNPTGGVFPGEAFRQFLTKMPPETLVLLDEAYHEYDESGFDSVTFLDRNPNLIITRTFSKAYGLAGLRVGYGLARPDLWRPCRTVREPFSVNVPAQEGALAALQDLDHLEATLANNREGKQFMVDLCREMGLDLLPSQGNFMMIHLGRPAAGVFEGLLRQGVIVRPCGGFGRPDWIRVTIGTPTENRRFAEALKAVL